MKNSIARVLCLLLACMLVFSMGIMSYAADNAIPGDVSNNGTLDILDALLLIQSVANDTPLENSDVNCDGKTNLLDAIALLKFISSDDAPTVGEEEKGSANIVVENGTVKEAVSISGENVSAAVPEGVAVKEDTTELTLSVTALDSVGGNIATDENEDTVSYDVHIEGVSEENTVAIIVDLGAILPVGQNFGTLTLYHIENGETVRMIQVMSLADLDKHNEFYYYPETGNVYVALATFSEIALINDTVNPWNGEFDYSWYTKNPDATEFIIANADQLAAFGALVGGMAKDEDGVHIYTDAEGTHFCTFNGKTVKLVADINLGDKESENNESLIFYPIGYHNSKETYDRSEIDSDGVVSDVYSFEGTFDGNGHTIANFYQNTWEMIGDDNYYSKEEAYYKDGMGLFGYVLNGTVKNLTVDNFSSDGEFTPTGVIAAYSANSTFENIAITNCNPRVYNTGNGGIIGIAGISNDTVDSIVLKNITVDNTNKISALWGSWDVSCGGLVGMYRGHVDGNGNANGDTIHFENCHVAAQIDVYNDVCANYQYYAYRYAGMIIGSVRHNTTDANGRTVPNMANISAKGCTVNFGTWNDYYYCELVANTLASYTHDHQFSRLVQVKSVSTENKTVITLDDEEITVPDEGTRHYVVVGTENGEFVHSTNNATCYHFVNGEVYTHDQAGTETVNGVEGVLKEDNQHIYLEFNQLFTGYGWGVSSKGVNDYEGVDTMGITIGTNDGSTQKFRASENAKAQYNTDTTITRIRDLFYDYEEVYGTKLPTVVDGSVEVFVSPVGDDSTAGGIYTPNRDDWKDGTLTFTGIGRASITITDYNFCTPTTIYVTILSEDYHVHTDGTSDLVWKEVDGGYQLVAACNGETFSDVVAEPFVYYDPKLKYSGTSDYANGITKDTAVATLSEAVTRLKTSGGRVIFASTLYVTGGGINNPLSNSNKLPDWEKTITFTALGDGITTVNDGFRITSHGPVISFGGPAKLENIIINGATWTDTLYNNSIANNLGGGNSSDGGYYCIPVFVANWNDFTIGEGVQSFGAAYFIAGNFFTQNNNHTISQYADSGRVAYLTWDAENNRGYTDLGTAENPRTVNVTLNKTVAHKVEYPSRPAWPVSTPDTFDRVYLGTRNRTNNDLTVKNVTVNYESNNASINLFYAGCASGSYTVTDAAGTETTYVVDTQMENYTVDVNFNGTTEKAYVKHFTSGANNVVDNGIGYLDKLTVNFSGTAHMKAEETNKDIASVTEKAFMPSNVKDLTVTLDTNNTDYPHELQFFISMSDLYEADGSEKVSVTFGSHSFADNIGYPRYNEIFEPSISSYIDRGRRDITFGNANASETIVPQCDWSEWVDHATDLRLEISTCGICGRTSERENPELYHEHSSDVYAVNDGGNYILKCGASDCDYTFDLKTTALPVVYVDPEKSLDSSVDTAVGVYPEYAVASLGTAVTRLKETGGTIKLMSNVVVGTFGVDHPLYGDGDGYHNIPVEWKKEITFTSYTTNASGEADKGFVIGTHGAIINLSGVTKLENIVIDGRTNTANKSDGGYYNIPVFVSNWHSLATGEGVVSYGKSYFVIGHNFASNHKVSEYAAKGVPHLEGDSTNGYVSAVDGISINVTFTATKTKGYTVTLTDGTKKTQAAVDTYGLVYLGNRNEYPTTGYTAANNDITCTVEAATIHFESRAANIGTIYAASTGKQITANNTVVAVTTPVLGGTVYVSLQNGTATKSNTESIQVGSDNFTSEAAVLDKLVIHLYDNAYISGNDNSILTRNVDDLQITVNADGKTRVKGAVTLTVGKNYTPTAKFARLYISAGSHAFASAPAYNERYAQTLTVKYNTDDCSFNAETGICSGCGKTAEDYK